MPKQPPKPKPPIFTKSPESGVTKRLELEYERAIREVVSRVLPPKGSTPDLQAWIDHILQKVNSPEILALADRIAGRMVRWANIQNAKHWKEAAARSQRSQMLFRLLQKEMQGPVGRRVAQLVAENARLIRSVPVDAATMLTREVLRLQQRGARPQTIERAMRARLPVLSRNKARLIARTETQKASAALTHARADSLGLKWLIWRTSHDVRVRRSHRNLDDVLIPYAHPPQPEKLVGEKSTLGRGLPGEFPNCRCTQLVLLSPDDVSWPHKVYWQGRIQMMRKAEFLRIWQ